MTDSPASAPLPNATVAAAFRDEEMPGQTRFAGLFAQSRHDQFLYVHGLGWHYWTGSHWEPDAKNGGAAQHSLVKMLRSLHAASFGQQARVAEIGKMSSNGAQQGILSIASVMPEMAATPEEIDTDPYLLNCANGTLDLRTMELQPHAQSDKITKVTRAAYDPSATSDEWQQFLHQILPDDNVRGYLQRYIGYSLLGLVREHNLPIATGKGANGKSTLISAVLHALGDYGHTAEQDLFLKVKSNPNGAAPAFLNLMGRRFVVTLETEENAPLAVALMKTLIGGDAITARGLYQPKPITFEPSHTALMVTNHLPKVPADDDALWRRLVVVPFDVVIPVEDRDPGLPERLKLSADAILNWAVQGYLDYEQQGLNPPARIATATQKYRNDSDNVSQFIADTCTLDVAARTTRADLWRAWSAWASTANVPAGQQRHLYERLGSLGYQDYRTKAERGFEGLRINGADDDVFDDVDTTDTTATEDTA